MHVDRASCTSCTHYSFMRTPMRPCHTSSRAMSLTGHNTPHTPWLHNCPHVAHWHDPLFLHLLCVEESSAASHKCQFRVRHFGRVFDYLYKSVLMVDRALKDAGSDPPGPSASASSSNGTRVRDLNMQFFMRPLFRHRVARGARFEGAMFDSRTRRSP